VSTELDLGAMRTLADVCARMGHKVRLTPAELSALLAAAGEREALRARVNYYESAVCLATPRPWATPEGVVTGTIEPERVADVMREREELREKVRLYEDAVRNPGGDQRHRGTSTATQLVHAQHMREKAEAEVERLRAVAERCEYVALRRSICAHCGRSRLAQGGGWAQCTCVDERRERDALKAEVERLRAALSGLLERLRPQDFRGDLRFADAALDCARAALAPAAAIADEREANAKVCDDCYQCGCASAIRARGGA
jgi:hypothetical protein